MEGEGGEITGWLGAAKVGHEGLQLECVKSDAQVAPSKSSYSRLRPSPLIYGSAKCLLPLRVVI